MWLEISSDTKSAMVENISWITTENKKESVSILLSIAYI